MRNKNVSGIIDYAKKRNEDTIDKVNKAISKLKGRKNAIINFATVAKEAGVAKATLYNNPTLKERIMSLRAVEKNGMFDIPVDKTKALYDEISKLKKDKENLIIQLIEMDELRNENIRLMEQILRLKKSIKINFEERV